MKNADHKLFRGQDFTWKSSTEGRFLCSVRRWCHWWSVSRAVELRIRAACSSWKFLISDIAPYALVR